jgi:hypothetical protein
MASDLPGSNLYPPPEFLDVPTIDVPAASSDSKSSAEAQALASGTLEDEAAKSKHMRDEDFKNHVSRARKLVFWILIVSFMCMTIILVIHWITPWCFLTDRQLDTIKTIIGAALASKIFSDQAKHIS